MPENLIDKSKLIDTLSKMYSLQKNMVDLEKIANNVVKMEFHKGTINAIENLKFRVLNGDCDFYKGENEMASNLIYSDAKEDESFTHLCMDDDPRYVICDADVSLNLVTNTIEKVTCLRCLEIAYDKNLVKQMKTNEKMLKILKRTTELKHAD